MQSSATCPEQQYTDFISAARAIPLYRKALSPAQLAAHAQRVKFKDEQLSWNDPIDRTLHFICPTVTPLYYAPSWQALSAAEQLRYNQLTGLCTNELVGLFEQTLQPIFQNLKDATSLPPELRSLFPGFIEDETRHAEIWHHLNQLAEPEWYAQSSLKMVSLSPAVRMLSRTLIANPEQFPVVVWVALLLEEHSLEITRRCLQCSSPIEPRFLAAFRLHAQEEARHVQIDWNVLELLLKELSGPLRRINAWILRQVVESFFFRPVNAAMRVLNFLADEFDDLKPRLPKFKKELAGLKHCPAYCQMIFSRQANPITFELGLRFAQTRSFFLSLA